MNILPRRAALIAALLLPAIALLCSPPLSHASGPATVAASAPASKAAITNKGAGISFPNTIAFTAHIQTQDPIGRVTLEYGVQGLSCATVTAKAFPKFTDAKAQDVTWTWDMHKSGPLPTGAGIWYRWRVTDKSGAEKVSTTYNITWLDRSHNWQSKTQGNITLHWYNGTAQFAQSLLSSAVSSMATLGQTTGLSGKFPANLYIYANASDLKDALLYEPSWIGGAAFPAYNIVLIGISTAQLDWGKRAEAHELTHLLVGQFTFSCVSVVPTWLNEGIAVYGQGGPEADAVAMFNSAVSSNKLLPARTLDGGFSAEPGKADLSYSESYSLVNYLVKTYGKDKMRALFEALQGGLSTEAALRSVYGFGLQAFEDKWRASLGLAPTLSSAEELAPSPQPTVVPTYEPVSAAPLAPSTASTPSPAAGQGSATLAAMSSAESTATAAAHQGSVAGAEPPSNSSMALLAGGALGFAILLATGIIYFATQRRSN